jgi:hypothetical protein
MGSCCYLHQKIVIVINISGEFSVCRQNSITIFSLDEAQENQARPNRKFPNTEIGWNETEEENSRSDGFPEAVQGSANIQ